MIIKKPNSPINFGDTSFRRKNLIDDYRILLSCLANLSEKWDINNASQNTFYQYVLKSGLIQNTDCDTYEQKKRARTYTNAIVKIGLADENRKVSPIGKAFLNNNITQDKLERLLNLNNDNILFLRQLLKLKIAESKSCIFIFRIALAFLMKYDNVEQEHFCKILLSIQPNLSQLDIINSLDNYEQVKNGKLNFNDYINNLLLDDENLSFDNGIMDNEIFNNIFKNKKSSKMTDAYWLFYNSCVDFFRIQTKEKLQKLQEISKNPAIKKAFGFGKTLFNFPKNNSIKDFLTHAENHIFTSSNLTEFNARFYALYKSSKYDDLIKEYSDMLVRTFRLCGLISFDNALVNLSQKELISEIFLDLKLATNDLNDTEFLQDISTLAILGLENSTTIEQNLRKKYHIENDIKDFFKDRLNKEFERKILARYTNEKLCDILEKFGKENEYKNIQELVTDNASVPTIFEYILAIAWHRISKESFELRDSMNLSLDADRLPLSHAPGGSGDIVAKYKDFDIMLEATLMDKNAQKRGELEPVIRHSANLTIENNKMNKDTFIFFVADELDINVINIFRATAHIELESSQNRDNFTNGVKIFSLDIKKIIYLLKHNVTHIDLLKTAFKDYQYKKPNPINNGWFDEIWAKLDSIEYTNSAKIIYSTDSTHSLTLR
ncbi:hypothetical protein CCY99_02795 [Helicobacter sp. 16-1353]|uniref:AlwI family type II restriction endonuclease n=1 Tax=Helicobacter sp. 16-1353 TaxID=2004996 RepID=UPI000DCBBC1A|nr:AlwI family type II restriction endonuclease [Helicobacter sp. 16-1353]RAX54707.1 hypothetical protein CCY99_02795 [Helicobacter sp. 16-1353]